MFQQRNHLTTLSTALALSGICALPAHADTAAESKAEQRGSVYATLGPLGLSLGVIELNGPGKFSARVLLHSGSLSSMTRDDVGLEGNQYNLRQRLGPGLSVLGDYRPWQDCGWRLTGGLVVSRLNLGLTGRPDGAGNYNFNGHTYNQAQVGNLSGKLRYKPVSLYLGGGWESKAPGTPGWRFVSDLGVMLLSKPTVTLTGSAAAGNTALQQDLAAEQRELRKHSLGVVGSLGVAYGF